LRRRKTIRLNFVSSHTVCVLLLGGLFLIGGLGGCVVAGNVHGQGGEALRTYLEAYLSLAREGDVPVSFGQVVWEQARYMVLVFLMGFTAVGVIGVPVLFALRGFGFAFSVACFCRMFGAMGLIPALCLFGFPAIVWVPALFVMGTQSVLCAYQLLCRYTGGAGGGQRRDWGVCALCAGAAAACAALEYFVLPVLIGACSGFLV